MTTQQKPTLKPTGKQPATIVSFDWLVRLPEKPQQPKPKDSNHAQR